ncbi:MAG: hypothetical protein B6244_00495 [Candidatus Cloacimonetes bacterium 4572_55]|nr:MAG: hypothetical protein B6244_00495 [Candidatus Cloacimonetes bacterium 4572_55]
MLRKKNFRKIGILGICLFFSLVGFISLAYASGYDFRAYSVVLTKYVDQEGLVNYNGMSANSTELNVFLIGLENISRKEYENWAIEDKAAFWVNVYNAISIKAVCDNYPINSSIFKFNYPSNSIRQIDGVMDEFELTVVNEKVTLDSIYNGILRKFGDPRIHLAINAASIGHAPLPQRPFSGNKFPEELTRQTLKFLSDETKFKIDREKNVIYLSELFKEFREDFLKSYGQTDQFSHVEEEQERALLNFIKDYVSEEDKIFLLTDQEYEIDYLDFDWSLNEKPGE